MPHCGQLSKEVELGGNRCCTIGMRIVPQVSFAGLEKFTPDRVTLNGVGCGRADRSMGEVDKKSFRKPTSMA